MTMGKYIIILFLIVMAGAACGYLHYYYGEPNPQYKGTAIMTVAEHDKFMNATRHPEVDLLEYTELMKNGDRIAFSFVVRDRTQTFVYGEYAGNSTSDHAKNIAIGVSGGILGLIVLVVLVRRWLISREAGGYFHSDYYLM